MRSARLAAALVAALLFLGCAPAAPAPAASDAAAAPAVTIVNADTAGKPIPKVDTAGQPLDAHEGTIVRFVGVYYMIGNTYGCGYQWIKEPSAWCGFRTYSSPDLVHWTNLGATFNPAQAYFQDLCAGMGCFNARLIFDRVALRWRLWFNAYNARSGYQVLSAPSPRGPWTLMHTPNLAVGNNNPGRGNGAGGLFTDPANGKGYLAYTAWTLGGKAVVEELRPDRISGTGRYSVVNAASAEAPSLFKGPDGTFFVMYNDPGCAWCGGTGTAYATAPSPMGPWVLRGSISARSCNGQAASQVAALPGVTLFVSDQWTNLVEPRPADWNGMTDLLAVGDYNQTEATQHWEPLRLNRASVPGWGWISRLSCPATVSVSIG